MIVWPLASIQRVLSPIVWLTEKVSSLITRGTSAPPTTVDEILAMIHVGAKVGEVSPTELELLTAVFPFDETRVREVMIPRHEVLCFDVGWSLEECLDQVCRSKHTRYPLCRNTLDDTLGVVHVKDLICERSDPSIDPGTLARPVERYPDSMPIRQVLREMQRTQRHFSLVVDELGTVVGAVTMENVIEQLVGAVQDEFDTETAPLVVEEPGTWVAQGSVQLSLLNQELDLSLVQPGVHTLSGLMTAKLGRLPSVGDEVSLGDVEAEVLEVRQHRASRVRITASIDQEALQDGDPAAD
jgi:CBS domain containing-hemolysin-like protein